MLRPLLAMLPVAFASASIANEPPRLTLGEKARLTQEGIRLVESGFGLCEKGKYAEALAEFRKMHQVYTTLYPDQDHETIAMSMHCISFTHELLGELERSLSFLDQSLAMSKRVFKRDHNDLALRLQMMASLHLKLGDPAAARPYCEQALAMLRRLHGHENAPAFTGILGTLGELYLALGELDRALETYEQVLDINRRLHEGKNDSVLAESLYNVGVALHARGETRKARPFIEDSLAMLLRLPESQTLHSRIHALQLMGLIHRKLGEPRQAIECCTKALEAAKKLHRDRDHPDVLLAHTNLGYVLDDSGERDRALGECDAARAIAKRLYPGRDHPQSARALHNFGAMLAQKGEREKAVPYYEQAADMNGRLVAALGAAASEAESFTFLGALPLTRDDYLMLTRGRDADAVYARIWNAKAVLTQILQRRAQAARAANIADPDFREKWVELRETRRRLARLLLASGEHTAEQVKDQREVTERKERLEREVAHRLHRADSRPASAPATPVELAKLLPAQSVFLDLVRYVDSQNPKTPIGRYCAFLLTQGAAVQRVELGKAEAIDRAATAWRKKITANEQASGEASTLRRLVWEPIEKHLPKDTETIYLSPDGDLERIPFGALPGNGFDSILLEKYAFAVVPHGPFLTEQLRLPAHAEDRNGSVLLVGGVLYDAPGKEVGGPYAFLAGTEKEQSQIAASAGDRTLVRLSGDEATTSAVARKLVQARFAHLATHGFFAEELLTGERRRWQQLRTNGVLTSGQSKAAGSAGIRSPLGYVGLVLAGANTPEKGSPDGGILSGEAIVGLDLDRLNLVVLSACETGLGDLTGGEGVQGLQRAFHLAGCQNVVCSLWSVNDEATAALMRRFYYHLWEKKLEPLQALRFAQLELYRNPTQVSALLRGNAPKFSGATKPLPKEAAPKDGEHAATKLWAAFVFSGLGR